MKWSRSITLGILVFASLSLMMTGIVASRHLSGVFRGWALVIWLASGLGGLAAYRLRNRWWPKWKAALDNHTRSIDNLEPRQAGWVILLVVAVGLFAELMIIRWHGATFQVFGYFKNISLLACFLGLGIGYALGKDHPIYAALSVPGLSVQFLVLHLLRHTDLQYLLNNPVEERLTQGLATIEGVTEQSLVYGFLLTVFLLTALTTIPLGQLAGRAMATREKLSAYGWNLLGSIAGTVAFTACAFLWLPPEIWLLLCTVPLLILLRGQRVLAVSLGALVLAVGALTYPLDNLEKDVYSPYQRITYRNDPDQGAMLQVNGFFFQYVLDLRPEAITDRPDLQQEANFYAAPYDLVPNPGRVVIVGSGTGNDVAMAIRRGAREIHAVEIDPVVLSYGRAIHPERPYQNEKVKPHNNDARNYIRDTDGLYDLVVYGWLDSHTTASALSSVRLDSYVFTVEALKEARAHLTDRGLLSLGFAVMSAAQAKKLYEMLKIACDNQPPRVFFVHKRGRYIFAAGPGLSQAQIPPHLARMEVTDQIENLDIGVDVSTDDWPFIYMTKRQYPLSYAGMNLLLLLVGLIVVLKLVGTERGWFDPAFFFLGAGFMLVEIKAITELNLVFGSTWIVVSVVIFFVLVMAWLANYMAMKKLTPPPFVGITLLIASLVLGMLFSSRLVAGLSPGLAKIALSALLTVPVFFSGLVFSGFLAKHGSIRTAMASNLLGALFGGLMEYNALFFGYKSLYLLAIAMYLVAGLFVLKSGSRSTAAN